MLNVSVVICCHNSAERLPKTLQYLEMQSITDDLKWEVIVVDNASTDSTACMLQECWSNQLVPLKVVSEPKLGLSYARATGFREAQYEIVCFVDDDNWVNPHWVQIVSEIMTQHPDVGVCGGCIEAVSDVDLPEWFEQFQEYYAVGKQATETGDVTWSRGVLWGAGMAIRKSAWCEVLDSGFYLLAQDRQGKSLSSCGDSEMCLTLRSFGWRLWYDSRLEMKHFMPVERLNWQYLRRLFRGLGSSSVTALTPYFLNWRSNTLLDRLRCTWQWQTISILKSLMLLSDKMVISLLHPIEGDPKVLQLENLLGRFSGLINQRELFKLKIHQLRSVVEHQSLR